MKVLAEVSEAKDCIDEVIKIILEIVMKAKLIKEGGEYVAKCWHIVKNNTRGVNYEHDNERTYGDDE